MQRIDPVEIISGLFILAIGAYFFFGATEYPMGTMRRMGPGFVPHWLGAISMGLGLIVAMAGLRLPGPAPRIIWRPLLSILASIAIFAVLLPRVGLVVAALATSIVSMLGNPDASARMIAVTSAIIALICWLLFIVLLHLPIPALWTDV